MLILLCVTLASLIIPLLDGFRSLHFISKLSTASVGIITQAKIASLQYANQRAFTRSCFITPVNGFLMNFVIENLPTFKKIPSFVYNKSITLIDISYEPNYLHKTFKKFAFKQKLFFFFSFAQDQLFPSLADMTLKGDVRSIRGNMTLNTLMKL